jgi:heme/copper-type cytochrome/quinol oxidase subunit 3
MLCEHALHLLAGIALLAALLYRIARAGFPRERGAAEAGGYYWHFVDALWLAIFTTVYVLR